MNIQFVSNGRLGNLPKEKEGQLVVLGFEGMGEVNYEAELKGESVYFEEGTRLSKSINGLVVCGCVTDTRGHKRKSAFVAEQGRILGVSDALHAIDGEVAPGSSLRVYETKIGRMGVAVAEDIFFPEVLQSLALCGSDFVVCPFGKVDVEELQPILRAQACVYGVPIIFCGVGYAMIADSTGKIVFASPNSPVKTNFTPTKEYHLVETRRRGRFGKLT